MDASKTDAAILDGDRLRRVGDAPMLPPGQPVQVSITAPDQIPIEDRRGRSLSEILEVLRASMLRCSAIIGSMRIIDQPVLERAVGLRQRRKMSLGDAMIAATAMAHGLSLATRNLADFEWIAGLTTLEPLAV